MSSLQSSGEMLMRWARALHAQEDDSFAHNVLTLAKSGDVELLRFIATNGIVDTPRPNAPAFDPDLALFFNAATILTVEDTPVTREVVAMWQAALKVTPDDLQSALGQARTYERAELIIKLGANPLGHGEPTGKRTALGQAFDVSSGGAVTAMMVVLAKQNTLPSSVTAGAKNDGAAHRSGRRLAQTPFLEEMLGAQRAIAVDVLAGLQSSGMPSAWSQEIGRQMMERIKKGPLSRRGSVSHDVERQYMACAELGSKQWKLLLNSEFSQGNELFPFALNLSHTENNQIGSVILRNALESGLHPDDIGSALADKTRCPLLQSAIQEECVDTIQLLLGHGADPKKPNARGEDGFSIARTCQGPNADAVRSLLASRLARDAIQSVFARRGSTRLPSPVHQ